jgi:pyruvate/2-oxoglutarate dehydrogenase complex dihydrolipoamide acyltransferase (E2) component
MDISKISTSVLEGLIKLTKKREALLEELESVEAKIAAAYSGSASAKPAAAPKAPVRRGRKAKAPAAKPAAAAPVAKAAASKSFGRRGALKGKIIAALRAAGDKGIAVKDLSKKIGVKNQNVHVWFSSTGKKLGVIQKVGSGSYRLKPGV